MLRNGEKSLIPVCTVLRCYWRGRGIHYKSLIHNQPASQIGHNGNVWDCGGCCRLSGDSLCHLCMYNIFKMFSSLANIQDWILDTQLYINSIIYTFFCDYYWKHKWCFLILCSISALLCKQTDWMRPIQVFCTNLCVIFPAWGCVHRGWHGGGG